MQSLTVASKTPEGENDFLIARLMVFISVNLWPSVFQFGGCILTHHCLLCSRAEERPLSPHLVALELNGSNLIAGKHEAKQ